MRRMPRYIPISECATVVAAVLVGALCSKVAFGKTCLFGDATYMKMPEYASEQPLILEPSNRVNGIFLRRGEYRHQYFLDMPNNAPPGYEMGLSDPVTQTSYPTFVIDEDGDTPENFWPSDNKPGPEKIIIKGIGKFQRVCPN